MTDFEKAREEEAGTFDAGIAETTTPPYYFKEGAAWAYEYCKNHRPYAEVCNSFAELITEENIKLKRKIVELEKIIELTSLG